MRDSDKAPTLLGEAFLEVIRVAIREELSVMKGMCAPIELLTPDQLAERLNVPRSWVYEQSRQGNLPTHRIGRYIRFDISEVLENQRKKINPS